MQEDLSHEAERKEGIREERGKSKEEEEEEERAKVVYVCLCHFYFTFFVVFFSSRSQALPQEKPRRDREKRWSTLQKHFRNGGMNMKEEEEEQKKNI